MGTLEHFEQQKGPIWVSATEKLLPFAAFWSSHRNRVGPFASTRQTQLKSEQETTGPKRPSAKKPRHTHTHTHTSLEAPKGQKKQQVHPAAMLESVRSRRNLGRAEIGQRRHLGMGVDPKRPLRLCAWCALSPPRGHNVVTAFDWWNAPFVKPTRQRRVSNRWRRRRRFVRSSLHWPFFNFSTISLVLISFFYGFVLFRFV